MSDESDWLAPDADRAEALLDRINDGVFGLDTSWKFTHLNERGRSVICDAVGEQFTADELVGRNIWDLLPDLRDTTFGERYHEAMRTQNPVSFDACYRPLDAWIEVTAYPSETGLTVCFRDITERRRRREELETREAALREMYDAIADPDASFEERVDDLLRIGQGIFGTEYGTLSRVHDDDYVFEVVRAPDDSIQAGDIVDLSATNCEQVVLTEETLVLGNVAEDAPELTDRAGFTEWGISCYLGTPVVVDDDVYGTFCFYDTEPRRETFSDWEVTLVDLMGRWVSVALERKLVEERLRRQNDRLEKFATLVSHDLRNPLNVANGWLDVAREERESEALDNIASSHDRMESLIDDVLTLARAGHTVDDPVGIDLDTVVTDAWDQVQTHGAAVSIDTGLTVQGDPTRLQQLFENLFRNSVEHGSTGNRPQAGDSVEHGSTENRRAERADDSVEHGSPDEDDLDDDTLDLSVTVGVLPNDEGFYVEDDGVGIPADERKEILEFGYSAASDGTGIGLGVVKDIAEAHGWTVTVTAANGGGARFEFRGVV